LHKLITELKILIKT